MASEIKVVLRQVSASASEATVGSHKVLVDRPIAKGGSDLGPMGGELFLSAIGGCLMSNLLAAVKARNAEITGITTEVAGAIADSPARFVAVAICVSAEEGNRGLLAHLVQIADQGCIMMNTLRDKLDVSIRIGEARHLVESHSEGSAES
jgi:putative redox protein